MLINDQVVCIRVTDYSETSQIVIFFARSAGKLPVIAKGAKRQRSPFGGPIEVFSSGNVVFSDSGRDKLATLVEFEPLAGITNLSVLAEDLYVLNCCLFAAELVNLLTKDYDPHPGLFDGLLKFLNDVTEPKNSRNAILSYLVLFQLRLLKEIGLSPVLDHCVNCKTPLSPHWQEAFFSNNAKGLICRDCQGPFPDRIKLSVKAVNSLPDVKALVSLGDREIRGLEDILIAYFTDALGRIPKMAKYVLGNQNIRLSKRRTSG
jgi:DNA repair protein RecO (recombination protein O)